MTEEYKLTGKGDGVGAFSVCLTDEGRLRITYDDDIDPVSSYIDLDIDSVSRIDKLIGEIYRRKLNEIQ